MKTTQGIRKVTSTRQDGSIKSNKQFNWENIHRFLKKNSLEGEVKVMQQVHSNRVAVVTELSPSPVEQTDGIVTKSKRLNLGVVTADCLPVTFYDPVNEIIGVAHAGYKGVYNGILPNVVRVMSEHGSDPINIIAEIGPSIGVCHYNVDRLRAQDFSEKFSANCIENRDNQHFLDLKKLAKAQLRDAGVTQIIDMEICTQCNNKRYYSYRADSDKTFGEFITMIGMYA